MLKYYKYLFKHYLNEIIGAIMINLIFTVLLIILFPFHSFGFTIKSGQVMSSDGEVYDFASPKEKEKLIQKYMESGESKEDKIGVMNGNLFIIIDGNVDDIVNIPMGEINGVAKDKMNKVISDAFKNHEVKKVKKYVEMPADEIKDLNAEQISRIPPAAMSQFSLEKIEIIPPSSFVGFKPAHIAEMSTEAFEGINPEQFSVLAPEVFSEINIDMMNIMPVEVFDNLSSDQLGNLVVPTLAEGVSLGIELPTLNSEILEKLPGKSVFEITPDLAKNLDIDFSAMDTAMVNMPKFSGAAILENVAPMGQMFQNVMVGDMIHDLGVSAVKGLPKDMLVSMSKEMGEQLNSFTENFVMPENMMENFEGFENPTQDMFIDEFESLANNAARNLTMIATQGMIYDMQADGFEMPEGMMEQLPFDKLPPIPMDGMMPIDGGEMISDGMGDLPPLENGMMPPMPNMDDMMGDIQGEAMRQAEGMVMDMMDDIESGEMAPPPGMGAGDMPPPPPPP